MKLTLFYYCSSPLGSIPLILPELVADVFVYRNRISRARRYILCHVPFVDSHCLCKTHPDHAIRLCGWFLLRRQIRLMRFVRFRLRMAPRPRVRRPRVLPPFEATPFEATTKSVIILFCSNESSSVLTESRVLGKYIWFRVGLVMLYKRYTVSEVSSTTSMFFIFLSLSQVLIAISY